MGRDRLDAEEGTRRAIDVAASVKPLLAGHDPGVQGAALVQLVALHLAGHPPQMRETVLAMLVSGVRKMLPVFDAELFGPDGHPASAGVQCTPPPITNDTEHAEAILEVSALMELDPDPEPDSYSGQRLRALAEVIEAYEKTRWPI